MRRLFIDFLPRVLCMAPPKRRTEFKHFDFPNLNKALRTTVDGSLDSAGKALLKHNHNFSYPASPRPGRIDEHGGGKRENGTLHSGGDSGSMIMVQACSSTLGELNSILRELKYITKRLRQEDEDNYTIVEWQFIAMVMDRMCFILFTALVVGSTCLIIFSAPHIVV